ncbi:MAG: enoyl-CoA hydratase/isomerase family protein [Thermoanaerobaculales bacterium]|jgi:enoyl-CoA hydratase|nr:enoyl-CoA hydratase/isomerase family protein [Thermoanaerobaculales bacterium]
MADERVRRVESRGLFQLVLNDGPNALNLELMGALTGALAELRTVGAPPVLLRSSHPTLFCPGWDLKRLAGAGREEVASYLASFNALVLELFSYPGPTAAAIAGHAVAGGLLLTMCCDLRVMATGRPRVGLSELNLGVPLPASSLIVLNRRLTSFAVEELVVGDGCSAERARSLRIVHRGADPERVVAETESELGRLAAKPARAFAETKRLLLGDSWARMAEPRPGDDAAFLDCWLSPETQQRIAATVARLGA